MIVCIAGKNNIAINVSSYILSHYTDVVICAIPNRDDEGIDKWQKSYLKYIHENPWIRLSSLEEIYEMQELMFLSLEFDRIINVEKFYSKRLYNIHFSLLPAYKGVYTSALPILYGESESGVTLHCIDNGIDTGNIIDQIHIPLSKNETAESLYLKYIDNGTELVIQHLENLIYGNVMAVPQDALGSSYFSRKSIDYANLSIDLNKTAAQIDAQIRAYYFPAYQFPEVLSERITHATITKDRSFSKAGTVLENQEEFMRLSTVDFDIILHKK